jgi:hypothetical protein
MCAVPGDGFFLKYTWFKNRNYILDLESLLKRCKNLEYLQIHIPEFVVNRVLDWLSVASPKLLSNVRELHLNVLVQNIDLVQGQRVTELMRFGKATCTTAHAAYSNRATRDALGIPLHKLGCCNGPEYYSLSTYHEKEPLLVVSPDVHPLKKEVLQRIAKAFPNLRIQVIENLAYEDYKELIGRAKWSLTFGEGLDGYFAEPILCGGVSFAVFNGRFFTPPFAKLETVYPSWEVLADRIVEDLRRLDEPVAYTRCWQQSYALFELDTPDVFRENLKMFYRGEYTFP